MTASGGTPTPSAPHLHVLVTPEQLAAATGGAPATTPVYGADHRPDPDALSDLLGEDLLGQHRPAAPVLVGSDDPLTLGALRRLACDATAHITVQQDLRAGDNGHTCDQQPPGSRLGEAPPPGWVCTHRRDPLYVGRSSRTVTGAQFKALVARDRHCVVRGCHRPPASCEAHHVEHWLDGGRTDLSNLVLLCHAHHHDHHDRHQQLPHRDGVRWLTETGWASDPPLTLR